MRIELAIVIAIIHCDKQIYSVAPTVYKKNKNNKAIKL